MGSMALVIVLWYGGSLVIKHELTVGSLSSFLIYTLLLAYALGHLSNNFFEMNKSFGTSKGIYNLYKRKPVIRNSVACRTIEVLQGHIQVDHVAFAYPLRPTTKVLSDFSLDIKAGEVCALVGESGGGKSTIINLMLRFYDPQEGTVSIDGIDIKELDMKWLHASIGVVNQEPCLFATSIAKNIAYAKPDATMEEIQEAARKANAVWITYMH